MKYILYLLLLFNCCFAFCQKNTDNHSEKNSHQDIHKELLKHIPEDYTVLDTVFGDLNLDKYEDAIMVLKLKVEDTLTEPKRPLLIFIGEEGHKVSFTERNDDVVLCYECGGVFGDPYEAISIKTGYFSVEHYGGSAWRWTRIITFKYSPLKKTWFLHKDGGDYYHAAEPEKVTTSVKTVKEFGTIAFKEFHN